jgi:ABC-type branched-subunit amino acid transport system substrate-binding protein
VQSAPDIIFSAINDQLMTLFDRSLEAQGLKVPVIAYDGDTAALPPALKDPNLYILSGLVFTGKEEGAGVSQYRAAVSAAGLDPLASFVNKGYLQAAIIAGGLKACGFPCSGTQMQSALDKLKVDTQGFTSGPVSYSPDNHQPYHRMNVYHWDAKTSTVVLAGGPYDGGETI